MKALWGEAWRGRYERDGEPWGEAWGDAAQKRQQHDLILREHPRKQSVLYQAIDLRQINVIILGKGDDEIFPRIKSAVKIDILLAMIRFLILFIVYQAVVLPKSQLA